MDEFPPSIPENFARPDRIVALCLLGYAVYLVFFCPCDQLLKCKDHMLHFQLSIMAANTLILLDYFIKPK